MSTGNRVCFRLKYRFPVVYQIINDATQFSAVSTDISTSGLGIQSKRPLPADALLQLELYLPGLRKLKINGRIMHQHEVKNKNETLYFKGIRFEEPDDAVLKKITRFISAHLTMRGPRSFVLLFGGTAALTLFARALTFTSLDSFSGTAFGNEWIGGWNRIPLKEIAMANILLATYGLLACLTFVSMRKKASSAVLGFAIAGALIQAIRLIFKFSFLSQGALESWIFCGEAAIALWFGLLAFGVAIIRRDYEEAIVSMEEDLRFMPEIRPLSIKKEKGPDKPGGGVSIFRAT